jgi:hypothetical protein
MTRWEGNLISIDRHERKMRRRGKLLAVYLVILDNGVPDPTELFNTLTYLPFSGF